MIWLVTGTLGAGKSYFAVRKIVRAFYEGRCVASNIRLAEGWQHEVARHHPHYRLGTRRARAEYAEWLTRRYLFEPDYQRLMSTRLRGKGERRGCMVIDEAHNELNSRNWQDEQQRDALRKLTLARKRGWEVWVISQHGDNTDVAIRRIATGEVRLTNWQQWAHLPVLRVSLLPFPLFLALAFPLNQVSLAISASKVLWREMYLLRWHRRLYDTSQDYGRVTDEADIYATYLPLREGPPAAAAETTVPPAAGEQERAA